MERGNTTNASRLQFETLTHRYIGTHEEDGQSINKHKVQRFLRTQGVKILQNITRFKDS
jgi:hypothetical protein